MKVNVIKTLIENLICLFVLPMKENHPTNI